MWLQITEDGLQVTLWRGAGWGGPRAPPPSACGAGESLGLRWARSPQAVLPCLALHSQDIWFSGHFEGELTAFWKGQWRCERG